MALSRVVSEIFNVEKIPVRDQSIERGTLFDRLDMVFY